jgi:hypothetical protein
MFEYVNLAHAQNSGSAYLTITGTPATDGTARWYGKILLTTTAGTAEALRGKNRTIAELRERVEAIATERAIPFIVMQLPGITLATFTVAAP